MSSFHVHARVFEGPLSAPARDELQSAESEDLAEMMALAGELVGRGFAVWLYEHHHAQGTIDSSHYRVIAEWRPDGTRIR